MLYQTLLYHSMVYTIVIILLTSSMFYYNINILLCGIFSICLQKLFWLASKNFVIINFLCVKSLITRNKKKRECKLVLMLMKCTKKPKVAILPMPKTECSLTFQFYYNKFQLKNLVYILIFLEMLSTSVNNQIFPLPLPIKNWFA